MITIAIISKPQGIKGELKLVIEVDSPLVLQNMKNVFVGGAPYAIESVRIGAKDTFIKLKGVEDRTSAETFRGKRIEILKEDAPQLEEGRYYITDILGSEIFDDNGNSLGKLVDVLQYGSADVYVIKEKSGKDISFPALKKVLKSIDCAEKRITIDSEEFEKVAVYED